MLLLFLKLSWFQKKKDKRFETVEHADSDSHTQEVLEAEAETLRQRREERQALAKLAKA